MTGIFPWGRYALSERLSVWGVAGYGEGSLTLKPEEQAAIRTDLDLWMAAAGLRGVLLDGGTDGPTLAAKSDAMIVRTASDAVSGGSGNLAAAEAEVTRLRLGLEGSQPFQLADGATLTPSVEIGVRHDGGDAETGFGVEIGGGLAGRIRGAGSPRSSADAGLLTHEAGGFRERGLSGSLAWDPQPASDRGPSVSLTQTVGRSASGGMNALLSRDTLTGLAANDNGAERRRLEARFRVRLRGLRRRVHDDAGARARPVGCGARLRRGLAPDPDRVGAGVAGVVDRCAAARERERRCRTRARHRVQADGAVLSGGTPGSGSDAPGPQSHRE